MDENDSFIISLMQWSFSRLNSFYNCKYEWYKRYIEGEKAESSFYGEFGSFCHGILERYSKGEIFVFELSDIYQREYMDNISHDAPPNPYKDLGESYYNKGLDYFDNIDLDLENNEVLGVEKKVEFEISGKPFVGYIDLLIRNKQDGSITILDHKSASLKFKKNGEISKTSEEHYLAFKRQLYLYSIPIIAEYGKVDYLEWNMFKDRKKLKIPWLESEYKEAIQWAKDTLKAIEKETLWLPSPEYNYCRYLCGQRNNGCEYKV